MLAYYYVTTKNEAIYTNYYNNLLSSDYHYHDLSSRCRVCLKEAVTSIYSQENSNEIIHALQVFGNITVSEDDQTKLLCSVCLQFITQAISFRKIAQKTDGIFNKSVIFIEQNPFNKNVKIEKEEISSNTLENAHSDHDISNPLSPLLKKERTKKIKTYKRYNTIKTENIQNQNEGGNAKVTCHICNKVLCKNSLKTHLKVVHLPKSKRPICYVCGKTSSSELTLRSHMLIHEGKFPFKCDHCPYRARERHILNSHQIVHTKVYKFLCTECPARFLFRSNLNRHLLGHKDPQFKCDTCQKSFRTKPILKNHIDAIHLSLKNHICKLCGYPFGYRKSLIKHLNVIHKRNKSSYSRMAAYILEERKQKEQDTGLPIQLAHELNMST